MKKMYLIFLVFLLFCSCQKKEVLRIGFDPGWYFLPSYDMQNKITGYVEELLLELSKHTGYEIVTYEENWNNLFDKMHKTEFKKPLYDVVIGSKKPYNFNLDQYDFSPIFLQTGYVFVAAPGFDFSSLKGLEIGYVQGEESIYFLERLKDVYLTSFPTFKEVLNALDKEQISLGCIHYLLALKFSKNFSRFLTEEGLQFVTLKDRKKRAMNKFSQAIEQMKKTGRLDQLTKKWLSS